MKTLALIAWFVWQAATAPFYPEPATLIAEARSWIEDKLPVNGRLTPALLREASSQGWRIWSPPKAWRDALIAKEPWCDPRVTRLYVLKKSIPDRPATTVNDVSALIAVDVRNTILYRETNVLRVGL